MIECIFTVDYEIFGNGDGSLSELIYEPAKRLMEIFQRHDARFVAFVELAELEMIETEGSDAAIGPVKRQIRDFFDLGFEIGLHLHPQWYNGQYSKGKWLLDYSEYNLCALSRERVVEVIDRSLGYLRTILSKSDFTPFSFRAGNWLLQPARTVAQVLAEQGIKVDSSVFKGGIRHEYKLDYRRAITNGYFWTFTDEADADDPQGLLLELPIYTTMTAFWNMLGSKRISLEHSLGWTRKQKLYRLMDLLRCFHPLKFDFCRMTEKQLINMVEPVIREDRKDPASFRPIVAIGHTKELVDFEAVESFLPYLSNNGINIATFKEVYSHCKVSA